MPMGTIRMTLPDPHSDPYQALCPLPQSFPRPEPSAMSSGPYGKLLRKLPLPIPSIRQINYFTMGRYFVYPQVLGSLSSIIVMSPRDTKGFDHF